MVSQAIQHVPQWSSTGGINSLVVNTLCVASSRGEDRIMEGTDVAKNIINRTLGRSKTERTNSQGKLD